MTEQAFRDLPVDTEGNPTVPHSGDIVQLEHYRVGRYTLDDGTRMIFNPQIFTVLGHVTKTSTQRYYLDNIHFYDWGVVLRNENSKCVLDKENWDTLTGLETSSLLWRLKKRLKENERKEAYVEITTRFRVYYGWSIDREWLLHKNGEWEWRVTQENLLPLKKIVIEEEEAHRARQLMEEIKAILQRKLFLPWEDILELARKYTIPEREVEEFARSVTWKKDYDEFYVEWLKKRTKKVLYSYEGLFFLMPGGITILEDPEPDKATYIFLGDPNFIAGQIEGIRQNRLYDTTIFIRDDACDPVVKPGSTAWRETLYRLKKAMPEKLPWFIGRVVHYDHEQWIRDLNKILEEVSCS